MEIHLRDRINKVFLVLLLLFSVDTVLFGTNSNRTFLYIPRIIGIIFFCYAIFSTIVNADYQKKARKIVFPFLTCFLILTLSFILNKDDALTYVSRIISISVGCGIAIVFEKKKFVKCFLSFMFFVCAISLLTEIAAYIFPSIFNLFPSTYNSAGNEFKCFLIGSVRISDLGTTYIRNYSIFWEPGAFAIYLIFTLGLELFCNEKVSLLRTFVFVISLITTFSTTGYICLGVLYIGFLLHKYNNERLNLFKKISIFLVCGLGVSMIFIIDSPLFDMIFGKIFNLESSAVTRFSSFFNGIIVAIQHPLFGVGSNTEMYMKEVIKETGSSFSSGGYIISNTIVGNAASFGIIFGFIFAFGMIRGAKRITISKVGFITFCLAMLLAYFGEKFFSFFPFILVFYGFKGIDIDENCRN